MAWSSSRADSGSEPAAAARSASTPRNCWAVNCSGTPSCLNRSLKGLSSAGRTYSRGARLRGPLQALVLFRAVSDNQIGEQCA